jgi:hypothetical protein
MLIALFTKKESRRGAKPVLHRLREELLQQRRDRRAGLRRELSGVPGDARERRLAWRSHQRQHLSASSAASAALFGREEGGMGLNWQSRTAVALALPLLAVTLFQVVAGASVALSLVEVGIGFVAVGLAWWSLQAQQRHSG